MAEMISRDEVLNALLGAVAASQAAAKGAAEQAAAGAKAAQAATAAIDALKKSGAGASAIPGRREADGSVRFQLAGQWWLIRPSGEVLKSEAPGA